jgi:hypothetical protein
MLNRIAHPGQPASKLRGGNNEEEYRLPHQLNRMRRESKILVATWILLFPLRLVYGQSITTVQGRVVDPSGGVVPSATVRVVAQPNGVARMAKSNGEGIFRIGGLVPGRYTVTVSAQSFTAVNESFELAPGRTLTLHVHLTIAQQ